MLKNFEFVWKVHTFYILDCCEYVNAAYINKKKKSMKK